MQRILLLLTAGIFSIVFIVSSNTSWMKLWTNYRTTALHFSSDRYAFGDLYGLSYLSPFKDKAFPIEELKLNYIRERPSNNVHLYSICDSYLWTFLPNDSLFRHAENYQFTRWDYEAKKFYLNPSKNNILLLEMVERRVRYTVPDTSLVYKHLEVVDEAQKQNVSDITPSSWLQSHLFNKNIEQNLEFNLFDYPIFTPFKEWKAYLNYVVFNRQSQDVTVSKTRNQLYYSPTVVSTANTSSFNSLPEQEVTSLVASLNQIYHHYRRAGFTEVYLAIMPNPVTVLEPRLGAYNNLIPRLQHHPALQMPVIDVYSKLQHLRNQPIYQRSDSHWSKIGFLAGIAQIDSTLATQSK